MMAEPDSATRARRYPAVMASIHVDIDEALAARLAERAKRAGVTPEELAGVALEEYLAERPDREESEGEEAAPFAWFGKYGSDEAQSDRIDELLAKGFGR
jgi:hypothetical protein